MSKWFGMRNLFRDALLMGEGMISGDCPIPDFGDIY